MEKIIRPMIFRIVIGRIWSSKVSCGKNPIRSFQRSFTINGNLAKSIKILRTSPQKLQKTGLGGSLPAASLAKKSWWLEAMLFLPRLPVSLLSMPTSNLWTSAAGGPWISKRRTPLASIFQGNICLSPTTAPATIFCQYIANLSKRKRVETALPIQ